jgi:tRNA pseudouridine38-40 synthase
VYCYKVVVSYDGTDYVGWQWQPEGRSVERVMCETFIKLFGYPESRLIGASRTDAGVHAEGQVALLQTPLLLDPEKIRWVWNNALPQDIVVVSVKSVDEQFHPRRNVDYKVYDYTFYTIRPQPTVQRFGWFYPFKFEYVKLARCLSVFVGTHDFRAFCKEDEDKDTVRTIKSISLNPCEKTGGYVITVVGHSFLRYMIRRIVGAALAVATKKILTENDLRRGLSEKKLSYILKTAHAKGLSLKKIEYCKAGI